MNALLRPLPGLAEGVRIDAARRVVAAALRAAGIESPDSDARLLVGHALSLDHAGLAARGTETLSRSQAEMILALTVRRLRREPVARIIGIKEFWSLPLRLSAETLVPRPETEIVVEATLDALATCGRDRTETLDIADFGTGSGAILLALLGELPNARGIGTDLNPAALSTARGNAADLGFGDRSRFVACDFGAALRGPLDCIVSNPPYILTSDIERLEPEVRIFDPPLALDGGPDGLSCYRRIADHARNLLNPGGLLIVELGAGLERSVATIMTGAGFAAFGPARCDLAGIPRTLAFRQGS